MKHGKMVIYNKEVLRVYLKLRSKLKTSDLHYHNTYGYQLFRLVKYCNAIL